MIPFAVIDCEFTGVRDMAYHFTHSALILSVPAYPDNDNDLKERSDEQLLELYLSPSKAECDEQFANTARVARMCKVTRRTVQLWISRKQIRAVPVGKRRWKVWPPSLQGHLKHYETAPE
jgi:hypothetical protein